MKEFIGLFFVLVWLSLAGCFFKNNLGITSAPVSEPQMIVISGPLFGDSASQTALVGNCPVSLQGSGGGTIEIEPIPDSLYGETFNAGYLTWYINKNDRF